MRALRAERTDLLLMADGELEIKRPTSTKCDLFAHAVHRLTGGVSIVRCSAQRGR